MTKGYSAEMLVDGNSRFVGTFSTAEKAAAALNQATLKRVNAKKQQKKKKVSGSSGKVNLHVHQKLLLSLNRSNDYEEEEEDQKSARINGVGRCCILSQ